MEKREADKIAKLDETQKIIMASLKLDVQKCVEMLKLSLPKIEVSKAAR